jgi:hypothetical protein
LDLRDEVRGDWKKLHIEILLNMYTLPAVIIKFESRRMRWAGHVARVGVLRNLNKILVQYSEGKRPLERSMRRSTSSSSSPI